MNDVDLVRDWVCPPARAGDGESMSAAWTLVMRRFGVTAIPGVRDEKLDGSASAWPRVIVSERHPEGLTAVGQYREGEPLVRIDVDRRNRRTIVSIPCGLSPPVRFADWLVRLYFGTHMLQAGSWLVHASSVGLDEGVVLFGGPTGAGKSSLAYLACAQLGAAFMADDLTLLTSVAGDLRAVGWPTRVSVPADLADLGAVARSEYRAMPAGWRRNRWILGPPEFAAATGFRRGSIAPVTAAVLIGHGPAAVDVGSMAAEPDQECFMTDVLGLMGEPAATPRGRDRSALSSLLRGIPVFRVPAAFPAGDVVSAVAACLRGMTSGANA